MQRLRLLVLGIVGFLGVFFAHGSWLNRLLAFALCGVLGADSGLCMAQVAKYSGQANATTTTLLSQRSREFDDPPTPSPANNPQAPPFPLDAGPNFIRPDFDGRSSTQPPQPPQNNTNQQPLQNIDEPATRRAELTTVQGCKFVINTGIPGNSIAPTSIEYTSENEQSCGQSFVTQVSEKGRRVEVIQKAGDRLIINYISADLVRVSYTDKSRKTTTEDIQIPREVLQSLVQPSHSNLFSNNLFSNNIEIAQNKDLIDTSKLTCEELRDYCETVKIMSTLIGFLQVASLPLTLVGIGVAFEGALGVAGLGVSFLQLPCFIALGGDPPIPWNTSIRAADSLRRFGSRLSTVNRVASSRSSSLGELGRAVYDESLSSAGRLEDINGFYRNIIPDQQINEQGRTEEVTWTDKLRKQLNIPTPCKEKPKEDPQPTPIRPSGPLKQGRSYGDPHIATFDGYGYSFQTIGEFILVQSKDGAFQVQTRQGQVPGRQMSLNTGVAMKVGNSKVSIYSKDFPDGNANNPVWVNDRPVAVDRTLELPGGGTIQGGNGSYLIQFPTGERVIISRLNVAGISFMNVNPGVPEQAGRYMGLLGNLNNNKEDDLQTRDGQVIPSKNNSTYGAVRQLLSNLGPIPLPLSQLETAFFDQLYKQFGDSWRVTQAESLFTYPPNKTTDNFTNRNFPSSYASLASLLPADIRRAEQICQQAGVPGDLLEGCLFDVAATGEGGFVQAALDNVLDQVRDRVQNEIRNLVPVPIPLPF